MKQVAAGRAAADGADRVNSVRVGATDRGVSGGGEGPGGGQRQSTLDQTSSTLPAKMTRRATSYVAESALTAAISAEVWAVLRASPSANHSSATKYGAPSAWGRLMVKRSRPGTAC